MAWNFCGFSAEIRKINTIKKSLKVIGGETMQENCIFNFLLSWSWDGKNYDIFQKVFLLFQYFCDLQKMIKIYFDWHLGSYFTHEPKIFNFQRYHAIKMTQIIVFWSNREVK